MTQGALIRNVADCQALYMQAKQTRSDILYMTTLDTGRCSHMFSWELDEGANVMMRQVGNKTKRLC